MISYEEQCDLSSPPSTEFDSKSHDSGSRDLLEFFETSFCILISGCDSLLVSLSLELTVFRHSTPLCIDNTQVVQSRGAA